MIKLIKLVEQREQLFKFCFKEEPILYAKLSFNEQNIVCCS